MAEAAAESPQQPRKWKSVTQSMFLGEIPYTNQNLQLMGYDVDCSCVATCDCEYDPPNIPSCECIGENKECVGCEGCDAALAKRGLDNRQISRLGLTPKQTSIRWLNEQMGHSLVMDEDWKAGEALIAFAGNIILHENVPADHKVYVLDLGSWEFKLKKDYGEYKKGKIFKGKWSMDCTDIGTDANFINSTCGNNNVDTFTQIVGGLPTPVAFGAKSGKAGMYSVSNWLLFYIIIHTCFVCQYVGDDLFWNYNAKLGSGRNAYCGECACGLPPLNFDDCTGRLEQRATSRSRRRSPRRARRRPPRRSRRRRRSKPHSLLLQQEEEESESPIPSPPTSPPPLPNPTTGMINVSIIVM